MALNLVVYLLCITVTSWCISISNGRQVALQSDDADDWMLLDDAGTPVDRSPPGTPKQSRGMGSGLMVALFILGLCIVILLTCCTCWVVGRCRERKRSREWQDVFDSLRPFPMMRTRVVKENEDDNMWRGPPPYQVEIAVPSGSDTESMSGSNPPTPPDPSTKMEVIDDSVESNQQGHKAIGSVGRPKEQRQYGRLLSRGGNGRKIKL